MANKHFGNIGDIWKHLPLAEILHIEKPRQYWESHAGSAAYEYTFSPERDLGAGYFFANVENVDLLKSSQFYKNFSPSFLGDEQIYPGSPLIALQMRSQSFAKALFCDIESESLNSIKQAAKDLRIADSKIDARLGDGVIIVSDESAGISVNTASDIFILIDPYCIFDESGNGLNPLHLFWNLTSRGFKTMLWYSFSASCHYKALMYALKSSLDVLKLKRLIEKIWCGEISSKSAWGKGKADINMGIMGCGLICGNLSAGAISACRRLGIALADLYGLSNGKKDHIGSLLFHEIELS